MKKNLAEKMDERGFGMVVRANSVCKEIVSDDVWRFPEDTCLIYSMWGGYQKLDEIQGFLSSFVKMCGLSNLPALRHLNVKPRTQNFKFFCRTDHYFMQRISISQMLFID